MAKKNPKPEDTPEVTPEADDDVIDAETDEEAAEVTESEEAAEVSEADAEAVAADEEAAEVAEDAGEAPGEPGEPEAAEVAEADQPLQPKVTTLTLVLCILALLFSIGAGAVVALDHGRRQEWSYAVFLHDLALMGLPLEEESAGISGSRETMAPVNLDPAAIKSAHQKRGGKGGSEPFQPVNEVLVQRIRPEDIGPDTAKILFQNVGGEPVKTLEQEVARVRKRLPSDIEAAAREAGKDLNDDGRRKLAMSFVMPLARNAFQVEALDKKFKTAKGPELEALLERGCRLRMIAEVLDPLEELRPLKTKDNLLNHLADFDNTKIVDDATALLDRRIGAVVAPNFDPELRGEDWAGKQRTSIDKREAIAFLLYTINQVKKPDGQLLFPKGPERTEVVVGMNEYIHAADLYAFALDHLRDQIAHWNEADLDYTFTNGGKQDTLPSFIRQYPEEIKTIEDLRAAINNRKFRLKELRTQMEQHEKQLKDRQVHYDDVKQQLLAARAVTARLTSELHKLQQEYFEAQRRLSDAAELNNRKVNEIRRLERENGSIR